MANLVVDGALLTCTGGTAPCAFKVVNPTVQGESHPAANIMDHLFPTNVPGFAMCTLASNPAVAASLGAPSGCIPALPAPWTPGKGQTLLRSMPALDSDSMLMCAYGGMIRVSFPGETTITVNR